MNQKTKIAIASGKGGTGKTFISTNLFNVLQKRDFNIALVDCDAEEPNDREFIRGELQFLRRLPRKFLLLMNQNVAIAGNAKSTVTTMLSFF